MTWKWRMLVFCADVRVGDAHSTVSDDASGNSDPSILFHPFARRRSRCQTWILLDSACYAFRCQTAARGATTSEVVWIGFSQWIAERGHSSRGSHEPPQQRLVPYCCCCCWHCHSATPGSSRCSVLDECVSTNCRFFCFFFSVVVLDLSIPTPMANTIWAAQLLLRSR